MRKRCRREVPKISFWGFVQWLLNRFVIGQHYWRRDPQELIIGFRVTEQKWAGDPNRAGWDYPKGPFTTIASFLNIRDAKKLEEYCRTHERGPVYYNIEPIQVQVPELRVLKFLGGVRKQFASIRPRIHSAYRRWTYNRRLRAES